MILRGHRTQQMADASLAELAAMAHTAEWTSDDLTAIGLMEELEMRGSAAYESFRQYYMAQMEAEIHRRRAAQRRGNGL